MNRLSICLLFLFSSMLPDQCMAQNLVPNPGFEQFASCPATLDGIKFDPTYTSFPFVADWVNPMLQTTSDYYNSCAPGFPGTFVGVPKNFLCNAPAHGGSAYAGIIPYSYPPTSSGVDLDYREYIQCRLTSTLSAGTKYDVSFFVRYAFRTLFSNNYVCIDRVGAHFSDTVVSSTSLYNLSLPAHIQNPAGKYIADTTSWIKVEGTYVAHGGEQYLTIGFFNDSLPVNDSLVYPPVMDSSLYKWSYLFIDDVSVTARCDTTISVADTNLCAAGPFAFALVSSQLGTSYHWSTGDTSQYLTVSAEGSYWRMAKGAGCDIHVDTFRVEQYKNRTERVHDTTACRGAYFTAYGQPMAESYLWSDRSTGPQNLLHAPGVYYCLAVSVCSLYTDTFVVHAVDRTAPFLTGRDITFCRGHDVVIGARQPGVVSYLWNTGDTGCCIMPRQSGAYMVTVFDGCNFFADTVNVTVTECIENCVFIPSAFTPNGDGMNDRFLPVVHCPGQRYYFTIYNRWGEVVFESATDGQGWDGSFHGRPSEMGVYYYYLRLAPTLHYESPDSWQKGELTLIR